MNARQEALLDYMRTIAPYLIGARSADDIVGRVISCMREDIVFVATAGITTATGVIIGKGRQVIEGKAHDAAGWLANLVSSFVSPKKPRRR
jgi:hypothetical protein